MLKKSLILLLLSVLAAAINAQSFELNLKPTVSRVYKCKLETKLIISMEMEGNEISVPMNSEHYFQATIKSIATNGDVKIEYKLTRVIADSYDPKTKKTIKFDTDLPSEIKTKEQIGLKDKLAKNLNKVLNAVYDKKGKIVSKSEDLDESMANCLVTQLPEQKVSVGSQWTHSQTDESINTEIETTTKIIGNTAGVLATEYKFTMSLVEKTEYTGQGTIEQSTGIVKNFTIKDMKLDLGFMKMKTNMRFSVL
jgi:hypothetical protein